MARALWSGAISFGLVTIPVSLYPAKNAQENVAFHMLHASDLRRVHNRWVDEEDHEVPFEEIVKGYEYEKDQYVVLTDDDFRLANVKATQTIDIRAFVGAGEIPVGYFEAPYYLAPARRGQKVYALLRETLRSSGRIAVAEVVIRTKQHLAAVVPSGRALMLVTLRYRDELRPASGLDLPPEGLKSAGVSAKEVALAKRLVDDMTERFDPADYKDTYHADLMARIRQKVRQGKTHEITTPETVDEEAPHKAKVIDLADLLRRSLGEANGARRKSAVAKRAPRGKPALRVVARAAAARRVETAPARRKRA